MYKTAVTFVFNAFYEKDKHEMQMCVDANAFTSLLILQ